MSDNIYHLVVARMPDEDLMAALDNHEKYVDDMLLAMINECEQRGLQHPHLQELKETVLARQEPVIAEEIPVVEESPVELPSFYSQTAILAFTLFFNPIFGGILLALNVHKVHKKGVWEIMIFSVIYTAFLVYVSYNSSPDSILTVLITVAGAFIFSRALWNNYLGEHVSYVKKNIGIPLVIALAITIPMLMYYIHLHPEILQMPKN